MSLLRRFNGVIRSHRVAIAVGMICLLTAIGIMASNGWLPSTDPMSGKRTGWFGKEVAKSAASSWNPMPALFPTPAPTPQLSKENIYAGSRLLSVVDANAQETPPVDLAVWRESDGYWYVLGGDPAATQTYFHHGTIGDKPVPGDYDGDGKTDFAVVRKDTSEHTLTWYIVYSGGSGGGFAFGLDTDITVAGDFDGDGKTDPGVYRPSNGTWYWKKSSTSYADTVYQQFGLISDIPAPADYDGDGKADYGVWRDSDHTFYTLRSSDATYQYATFTGTSGTPVPGDYDGDGKANYALRSGASWLILRSNMSTLDTTTPAGDLSTDTPVPNDYDGDGKCDIAVWRSSNGDWYIRPSSNPTSLRHDHWGTTGDTPVPAYFRR